jgi:type IV secretory pathway VirJ component
VRPLFSICAALHLALLLASAAAAQEPPEGQPCPARTDVSGLPLVELPATAASNTAFAVMLTGDGGWRRIDAKVTDPIRARGIPVVGFSTPEFFRERRTAAESACALERVLRTYMVRWNRSSILLIGYSRGAAGLPFMASRLAADLRQRVRLAAFLGLEPAIDFRYHPSWIPFYHPRETQFPVAPELEKMRDIRMLCVYGEGEPDSLCRSLDPQKIQKLEEPGGHHFNGRYGEIGNAIVDALER